MAWELPPKVLQTSAAFGLYHYIVSARTSSTHARWLKIL
jgi:hypothetical protein